MMNEDAFWALFEQAWSDNNPYDNLKSNLEKLSLTELLVFSKIYGEHQDALLRPAHLCASYLINMGVLDDEEFLIYTEAVVGAPRKVFLNVSVCPDSILDHTVYRNLIEFNTYPFASLPALIGMEKFWPQWREEIKHEHWSQLPTDIDQIEVDGKKGAEIVTRQLCQELVPRLYDKFEGKSEWSVIR